MKSWQKGSKVAGAVILNGEDHIDEWSIDIVIGFWFLELNNHCFWLWASKPLLQQAKIKYCYHKNTKTPSLNELEHNVHCPIEINEVSKTQLYRHLMKNRISYRESEIYNTYIIV